jgi:hypothetical protein
LFLLTRIIEFHCSRHEGGRIRHAHVLVEGMTLGQTKRLQWRDRTGFAPASAPEQCIKKNHTLNARSVKLASASSKCQTSRWMGRFNVALSASRASGISSLGHFEAHQDQVSDLKLQTAP